MSLGKAIRDVAALQVLMKFEGDPSGLKKAAKEIEKAVGATFADIVVKTGEAAAAQKKLEDQLATVSLGFDESSKKAATWQDRLSSAANKVFTNWESGASKVGAATKTLGEVLSKAERAAKALGIEMSPLVGQLGDIGQAVGALVMEAAKLPGIIKSISSATGLSLGQLGLVGAAGAAGVGIGTWLNEEVIGKHALRDFVGRGNDYDAGTFTASQRRLKNAIDHQNAMKLYGAAIAQGSYAQSFALAEGSVGDFELKEELAHPKKKGGRDTKQEAWARYLDSVQSGAGASRYALMQAQVAEQQRRASIDPSFLGTDLGTDLTGGDPGEMKNLAGIREMERIAAERAGKTSILESIFGKTEDVDVFTEKMSLLGDTIGVLGGTIQSTYDAWASGEKSLGAAFKEGAKAALAGIGSMLMGKAIQHGAEAIGELAWAWAQPWDAPRHIAAATMHGKAALAFGAGAAILGAASHAANSGGGGSATSGATAYGGAGGSYAEANRGPTSVTIINDSSSGHRSARWRARDTLENIQYAERYAGSGGNVVAYR